MVTVQDVSGVCPDDDVSFRIFEDGIDAGHIHSEFLFCKGAEIICVIPVKSVGRADPKIAV